MTHVARIGLAALFGGALMLGQSVTSGGGDGTATPPHPRRMGPPPADGAGGPGPRMHGMAALNLTEAQKAQHKVIFQGERESARAVEEQLRTIRTTMATAVKNGASEANIDLLASQEAPLLGQLEAIHAKAMGKFYGSLSADQKVKYEAMTAHRGPGGPGGPVGEHMRPGPPVGPPQE